MSKIDNFFGGGRKTIKRDELESALNWEFARELLMYMEMLTRALADERSDNATIAHYVGRCMAIEELMTKLLGPIEEHNRQALKRAFPTVVKYVPQSWDVIAGTSDWQDVYIIDELWDKLTADKPVDEHEAELSRLRARIAELEGKLDNS